jgi:hypothetical protein
LPWLGSEPGIFWFRLFSHSIFLPLSHSGSSNILASYCRIKLEEPKNFEIFFVAAYWRCKSKVCINWIVYLRRYLCMSTWKLLIPIWTLYVLFRFKLFMYMPTRILKLFFDKMLSKVWAFFVFFSSSKTCLKHVDVVKTWRPGYPPFWK